MVVEDINMLTSGPKIDLIAQELTAGLSLPAIGLLVRLMSQQWRREVLLGSRLQVDEAQAICRGSSESDQYRKALGELSRMGLIEVQGTWIEVPALRKEIEKAVRQASNRKAGWDKRRTSAVPDRVAPTSASAGAATRPPSAERKTSTSTLNEEIILLGMDSFDSNVAIEIPCKGGQRVGVTTAYLARLKESHPRIDTYLETKRAALWCAANPGKAKTPRGIAKFLASWMNSATSRLSMQHAVIEAGRPTTTGFGRTQSNFDVEQPLSHQSPRPGAFDDLLSNDESIPIATKTEEPQGHLALLAPDSAIEAPAVAPPSPLHRPSAPAGMRRVRT